MQMTDGRGGRVYILCVCVCVRAGARACVRACVRARVELREKYVRVQPVWFHAKIPQQSLLILYFY